VAVGRDVLVVPIRLPDNPYGFIAKRQGLRGDLDKPADLAIAIVNVLLRRAQTNGPMRQGLIAALENASSFAAAKAITSAIESAVGFDETQLLRVEAAIQENDQVGDSFGVPARLRRVVADHTAKGR
jgi:hypothetical protein